MNTKHKQAGKTLGGIMIGLVLACFIILGLLWFLSTQKNPFQKHTPDTQLVTEPEIIIPNQATELPVSETITPREDNIIATPPDELEQLIDSVEATEAPVVPSEKTEAPKRVEPAKKDDTVTPVIIKRSPEQILNAETPIVLTQKKPVAETNTRQNRQNVKIQMGSFTQAEQAEAHKAKLSMLGIESKVVTATVQGKTVYRVQSSAISQETAQPIRETLQHNHIDSILLPQ